MNANDKSGVIRKEMLFACFKIPSQHFPRGSKANQVSPQAR